MKVKVLKKAFYGNRLRYPGEEIDVPDDFKSSWAEVVEASKADKPKKKRASKKKTSAKTEVESDAAPGNGGSTDL